MPVEIEIPDIKIKGCIVELASYADALLGSSRNLSPSGGGRRLCDERRGGRSRDEPKERLRRRISRDQLLSEELSCKNYPLMNWNTIPNCQLHSLSLSLFPPAFLGGSLHCGLHCKRNTRKSTWLKCFYYPGPWPLAFSHFIPSRDLDRVLRVTW